MAQQVENLPAMQEMQVQSLGREDPLEEEMGKDPMTTAFICFVHVIHECASLPFLMGSAVLART